MKLWIGILIGVSIGFMIGSFAINSIGKSCKVMDDNFYFCVDELKECNNRSSTNIDLCEELLDEKNIFIKEIIDKGWEDCNKLLEESRDFCDERIEDYRKFIENDCKFEEQDFMVIRGIEYDCTYNRYNCIDFSEWADAQTLFTYCKTEGKGDIHHLDLDYDGTACDNLKWKVEK